MKDKREERLAARGGLLPLGIPDASGNLLKDLEVREWRAKQERELGKAREEYKNLNIAEYVGVVLATMISRIGPHDFDKLNMKERRLVVSQLSTGDAFYAYCWLRYCALGGSIDFKLACQTCGREFDWTADLGSLTVTIADCLDDSYWEYALQDPIPFRGGKAASLIMGPARWHHVETSQPESRYDVESAKLSMISGMIRGVDGKEGVLLTDSEIDEFTKRDIEGIVSRVDQNYIGPDMRVDADCPNKLCKAKNIRPIDWSYQSFFVYSSRSPTSKSSTMKSSPSATTGVG